MERVKHISFTEHPTRAEIEEKCHSISAAAHWQMYEEAKRWLDKEYNLSPSQRDIRLEHITDYFRL